MTINPRVEIDLSGVWQIAFDPANEGVKMSWPGEGWPHTHSQPIQVPQIWNITFPDAEGVGFYRTTFTVPNTWRDRPSVLRFNGVIYRCEVWINGKFVGGHEGGYTPFEFDVTHFIKIGFENSLVVRVAALSKAKAVDGVQLQHAPLSKQSWHYVYGGIWGRVTLETRPWVACHSLSIDPNLREERIQLELGIHNRREECRQVEILLRITDPRGALAFEQQSRVPVPPGAPFFNYRIQIPEPLAWSCEQPNLYHLETCIIDEDGQDDRQLTDFGMRDFTVHQGQFLLNGEPVYIRGVLLQPNYPINLVDCPSQEMMVREITLVKEAGFNLIRTHIQPASPEYLDLADRMGILIYAETSLAWIRDNPRMLDHGRREIREMIARDRNHPSVVFWGIYNENPPASAINGAELARFCRTLDPTRVIVENSGASLAIDQDFGWIDRAAVTPSWEVQPQRIMDVHLYLGSPIPSSVYHWLNALGTGISSRVLVDEQFGSPAVVDEFDRECRSYQGQVFVSELGCGGMADLDVLVAGFDGKEELLDARELKILRDSLRKGFEERRLERVFGSPRTLFLEAQELQAIGNTQQIEALYTNPRVSGFVITQLNDVSWEFHAGLLDLWRNPKPAYYAAQRLNKASVIILKATSPYATVGETVGLALTMLSQQPLYTGTQVRVSIRDPFMREIASYRIPIPYHPGIHPLQGIRLDISQPGMYQVAALLELDGVTLAETAETILALDSVEWKDLRVNVSILGQLPGSATINGLAQGAQILQSSAEGDSLAICLAAHPETLTNVEWEILFTTVETGAVAIVGALRPENIFTLSAFTRHGVNLAIHPGVGSWMGCYHWAPQSDLFSGLPAGGLVKKPYTGLIPKYVLSEMGGEVLAGSLRNTQSRQEAPGMLWYSDIEAVRYGKGTIIFCQYRVFENLYENPLAARMAYNLLTYAARFKTSI